MSRRNLCSGYSLMEMLVAISLMGVLMALFGRVVVTSVTLQGEVHDAAWSQDRVSQVVNAMRADVWAADALEMEGEDVLVLRSAYADAVRWSTVLDESGGDEQTRWALRREAVDGVRRFALPELETPPAFRLRGTHAIGFEIGGVTWWLASERVRLAKGGTS